MKTIALILMVAVLLEALVEYGKTIDNMVVSRAYRTAVIQGITILLGIGLAFIFKCQLFNEGMSEFYTGLAINPYIDMILTGILFSRGANYFSDIVGKFRKPTVTEMIGTEMYGEPIPEDDEEDFDDWDEDESVEEIEEENREM